MLHSMNCFVGLHEAFTRFGKRKEPAMRSRFVTILFSCIVVLSLPAQGHIATVPVLASAPRVAPAGLPAMRPASPMAGETWTAIPVTGTIPAVRDEHAAIYDPVNQRMVVYSGLDCSTGRTGLGDVQALSLGSTATWSDITPTGNSPVGRYNHSGIYDPVNQRMVIFGGATSSTQINDVLLTMYGPCL